jgi:dipeptidyl-peptidase 4
MCARFLLCILFQVLVIVPAVAQKTDYEPITLEGIFKNRAFVQKTVKGFRSLKNGTEYSVLEGSAVITYSFVTGEQTGKVFSIDQLSSGALVSVNDYTFSEDESMLLIEADVESIYRHSYRANYFIWDIHKKKLKPLSSLGKQQLATFSPDGFKVAFVRDNNLHVKHLDTEKEEQITFDGKVNEIINGAPDWVYEEEFGFNKAFEWSPDSRWIAYYRFDESRVNMFNMTLYGDLYPRWYQYKYPKAGEENSVVTIHVHDLHTGDTRIMDTGKETDQYIPRIRWSAEPGRLAIARLNRLQNKFELLIAEASTGISSNVYTDTNKYYIQQLTDDFVVFTPDRKHFIVRSEQDGFSHFYLYTIKGKLVNQITKGNWDVDEFLGFDERTSTIYYTSSELSPIERDLYSIHLTGRDKKRLSTTRGVSTALFSHGYKFYLLYHSSAVHPQRVSLHSRKGETIRVLEENNNLQDLIQTHGFTKKEFFSFENTDGIELMGYMIKPPDFDSLATYPLLMYVYGGPESQMVRNEWETRYQPWFQMLAQNGYIVACVDNRGTNGRGEAFRKATYMQLGKLETLDQIEAAEYMGTLPYVDDSRIGIFGWSYGGYMSALCMLLGSDIFKLGISVAPVTSWRFYDTIYTERFLRKPADNPRGYDDYSPIKHANKLNGKFMLVHGMADDNVHFQNSVELVEELVSGNKAFELMYYPNADHGMRGGNNTLHLYSKMTDFILNNL